MTTTTKSRIAADRAIQATVGILVSAVGIGAFDWRAGLAALGILTLVTSGIWKAPK